MRIVSVPSPALRQFTLRDTDVGGRRRRCTNVAQPLAFRRLAAGPPAVPLQLTAGRLAPGLQGPARIVELRLALQAPGLTPHASRVTRHASSPRPSAESPRPPPSPQGLKPGARQLRAQRWTLGLGRPLDRCALESDRRIRRTSAHLKGPRARRSPREALRASARLASHRDASLSANGQVIRETCSAAARRCGRRPVRTTLKRFAAHRVPLHYRKASARALLICGLERSTMISRLERDGGHRSRVQSKATRAAER